MVIRNTRYTRLDRLGGGGEGTVFKCEYRQSKESQVRHVAVKRIFCENLEVLNKAMHEAQNAMQLRHDCVVRCIEFFVEYDDSSNSAIKIDSLLDDDDDDDDSDSDKDDGWKLIDEVAITLPQPTTTGETVFPTHTQKYTLYITYELMKTDLRRIYNSYKLHNKIIKESVRIFKKQNKQL
jgi:serine/threonine protein kinase